jgi:hypothetical protein
MSGTRSSFQLRMALAAPIVDLALVLPGRLKSGNLLRQPLGTVQANREILFLYYNLYTVLYCTALYRFMDRIVWSVTRY